MSKKLASLIILLIILCGLGWYLYRYEIDLIGTVKNQAAAVAARPLVARVIEPTGVPKLPVGTEGVFRVTASGGVSPYTYTWTFPNGVNASSEKVVWKAGGPAGAGSVKVTVSDAAGKVASANTRVTILGYNTVGNVFAKLAASSPDVRQVGVSSTKVTPNVVLGIIDVTTGPKNSSLEQVPFELQFDRPVTLNTVLKNIRLVDGSKEYRGPTINFSEGDLAQLSFTKLSVKLIANQAKSLKLVADIAPTSRSFSLAATLKSFGLYGVDGDNNILNVTAVRDVTANRIDFILK